MLVEKVVDGLGGGICQITTTLYNAVVYANLDIVEKKQSSICSFLCSCKS